MGVADVQVHLAGALVFYSVREPDSKVVCVQGFVDWFFADVCNVAEKDTEDCRRKAAALWDSSEFSLVNSSL